MTGTLITVAPTGAEIAKSDHPSLPTSTAELAATARACEEAGASLIHIHVRDRDAKPTLDLGLIQGAVEAVRGVCGLVIQLSTGGAVSDDEPSRLAVLDAEPESGSLTCGSVNFGDEIFVNRWPFIVELYRGMRDRSIAPEFEIFDFGHLDTMKRLLDQEGPPYGGRVHANLVVGVPGGMAATAANLVAASQQLPAGATFSATGIGRGTLPVMLASLASGGHLRVGMEDTLTLARGVRVTDNAQLVRRAAEFSRLAQRPPLNTQEARQLLGIRPHVDETGGGPGD